MKKCVVVADWAEDVLAAQEVRTTIESFLGDPSSPNIQFVPSTTSTLHTSFLISQILTTEEEYGRPLETVIYQGTDPRISTDQSTELPEGAEFIVVHLASGVYLCGPNSGYAFSLIKDKIEEVYSYRELTTEAKFRSRDLYARIVSHLMDAEEDELDLEEVSSNIIPELKGSFIGHVDNFGTLKTTIISEDLKEKYTYGSSVPLKINNVEKQVRLVNKKYEGSPGELILYPGSSGHKDNPFMEISVWQDFNTPVQTAAEVFGNAKPGMVVEVTQ